MAKDAIELLIDDHNEVKRLFNEILEGDAEDNEETFVQLKNALLAHSRIELEIFYPRVQEKVDNGRDMIADAKEDHRKVEEMLTTLEETGVDGDDFETNLRTLQRAVLDHAENDEEKKMFVQAKQKMTNRDLEELGRQMRDRKMEVMRELGASAPTAR